MNSMEKAQLAVNVIVDKKGFDIQMLDVAAITSIADEIMDKLKAENEQPLRVEGYQGGGWILLDYNDLIIHIFLPDEQEYYKLPRLWKDAVFTRFDEEGHVIENTEGTDEK